MFNLIRLADAARELCISRQRLHQLLSDHEKVKTTERVRYITLETLESLKQQVRKNGRPKKS